MVGVSWLPKPGVAGQRWALAHLHAAGTHSQQSSRRLPVPCKHRRKQLLLKEVTAGS